MRYLTRLSCFSNDTHLVSFTALEAHVSWSDRLWVKKAIKPLTSCEALLDRDVFGDFDSVSSLSSFLFLCAGFQAGLAVPVVNRDETVLEPEFMLVTTDYKSML